MNLSIEDFFESQRRFVEVTPTEQICRIGWFIHNVLKQDRFETFGVTAVYKQLHLQSPNISLYLSRMAARKPPLVLKDKRGYYLEGLTRKRLDDLLLDHPNTVMVSNLLASLAAKIPDLSKQTFLNETIRCYRAAAFRAAVVMAWNLSYDHLRDWVFLDTTRLTDFGHGLSIRYPKLNLTINKLSDFDELKESQFLDVCLTGKIITKNLEQMLREKLRKRNIAAHPSSLKISQAQADDVIVDLVENVVLALT